MGVDGAPVAESSGFYSAERNEHTAREADPARPAVAGNAVGKTPDGGVLPAACSSDVVGACLDQHSFG